MGKICPFEVGLKSRFCWLGPKQQYPIFSWFWFGWDNPFTYFLSHSSASTHPPLYLIIPHCQKEVLFAFIKEYPMQLPWKFALLSHSCLPPSFSPLLSLIAYIEWSYCKKRKKDHEIEEKGVRKEWKKREKLSFWAKNIPIFHIHPIPSIATEIPHFHTPKPLQKFWYSQRSIALIIRKSV